MRRKKKGRGRPKKGKKRDWHAYNQQRVRRGEMLIPTGKAQKWNDELKKINEGKEGARFRYPDELIECLLFWKCVFKCPFTLIEGFGRRLLQNFGVEAIPDSTTICRRMKAIGKKYYRMRKKADDEEPIYAAFDGTGLKVFNRGEWMHYKHKGKRKGFVRVSFMFDVKTGELLDFIATTESVSEQSRIKPMVRRAAKNRNIGKLAIDGAGDSHENFELLRELGIKPAIKLRASTRSALSKEDPRKRERYKEARKYEKWGYEGWAKRRNYGDRWQAETDIACFKGYFDEYVFSRGMSNIKAEIGLKAHFYNLLRLG